MDIQKMTTTIKMILETQKSKETTDKDDVYDDILQWFDECWVIASEAIGDINFFRGMVRSQKRPRIKMTCMMIFHNDLTNVEW
jgi:hypothetical protein